MLYNIIGDIHGRTCWKSLLKDNAINIIMGDYFAPYDNISYKDCKQNFLEIIEYKKAHPETILLIGNHDAEYWKFDERYLYHDDEHHDEIKKLFEDNAEYFQVAYSIDNKMLATHAGVSCVWYARQKYHTFSSVINCNYDEPDEMESPISHIMIKMPNPVKYLSNANTPKEAYQLFLKKVQDSKSAIQLEMELEEKERLKKLYEEFPEMKPKNPDKIKNRFFIEWKDSYWIFNTDIQDFEKFEIIPDEVCEFINNLWSKNSVPFNLYHNCGRFNDDGNDDITGPLWIRPESLIHYCNIFKFTNYWQIFGHTKSLRKLKDRLFDIDTIKQMLILDKEKLIMCDCLEYNIPISILYNSDTNKISLNFEK